MNYNEMTYEQITKAQARKMHEHGEQVYILPNKANPNSTWWRPLPAIPTDIEFDKFINEYRFYNCNKDVGMDTTFYKEEEQFEPRKRTSLDGSTWWVVYDKFSHQYSPLLCFGKYKTKKECEIAIKLQTVANKI